MLLDNEKLVSVEGGAINATLLSSISRLITTLLDLGRTVGTAYYRYKYGNACR